MGNLDFYVYLFLDQRKPGQFLFNDRIFDYQPFYVGVGRKYRSSAHFTPSNLAKRNRKNSTIKAIQRTTGDAHPIHVRVADGVSQDTAFALERQIILHFGRQDRNTGILCNMTDGGEGNVGLVHSDKFLSSLRKPVHQYDLSGTYLHTWPSAKSVFDELGLNIKLAARNNSASGGYQWSYERKQMKTYIRKPPRYRFTIISADTSLEFGSFTEAKEYFQLTFGRKLSYSNVSSCANGRINTYLGFKWIKTLLDPAEHKK
jgi:hypothetical protein